MYSPLPCRCLRHRKTVGFLLRVTLVINTGVQRMVRNREDFIFFRTANKNSLEKNEGEWMSVAST